MTWVLGISSALGVVLWLIEKIRHGSTKASLERMTRAYSDEVKARRAANDSVARLENAIVTKDAEISRLELAFVDVAPDGAIRDQLNRVPSSNPAAPASGRVPPEASAGVDSGKVRGG